MAKYDIPAIIAAIDILRAWQLLQLPGTPKKHGVMRSPFRDERRPSFSIFGESRKWKDHTTSEGGDVIDFWMKATGRSKGECIAELAKLAGVAPEDECQRVLPARRLRSTELAQYEPQFDPTLDRMDCAKRLHDNLASLKLQAWLGHKNICESTVRLLVVARRMGMTPRGQLCFFFESGVKIRGRLNDAHSSFWEEGSKAVTPWRMEDAPSGAPAVLVTEGESDHMRMIPLAARHHIPVVSSPSASWRPSPEQAYRLGAFREVILASDADKAGNAFTEALCAILKAEAPGCRVSRLQFPDGADCCELSDSFLLKAFDRRQHLV